jgi:hypothetical protein
MNPIVKLILDKGVGLVESQIPKITDLQSKIPISSLNEDITKLKEYCLPKQDLEKILEVRNQIMNKINTVSDSINSLSKITDTIQPAIDTTNKSLDIAKALVNTLGTALVATPPSIPIPGPVITGYVNASNLVNNTLPPILTTNLNKLNSITTATDFANNLLLKLKDLLSKIDAYLTGCGIDPNNLTPLNDNLQQLQESLNNANNINNNSTYKGFVLEIVKEAYSPTADRRKAVAKNTQGIILLSTPLTFSTDDQTLINEIKLLIDSNNLKAD